MEHSLSGEFPQRVTGSGLTVSAAWPLFIRLRKNPRTRDTAASRNVRRPCATKPRLLFLQQQTC